MTEIVTNFLQQHLYLHAFVIFICFLSIIVAMVIKSIIRNITCPALNANNNGIKSTKTTFWSMSKITIFCVSQVYRPTVVHTQYLNT